MSLNLNDFIMSNEMPIRLGCFFGVFGVMSLNDCPIDESAMLPGIECGSMKALAIWVKK